MTRDGVYLYLGGLWQESGRAKGKGEWQDRAGGCTNRLWKGEVYSACVGGITVVYSVAVSFS